MTTLFGNPGSTELPFLTDFPADFSYVLGLHEGAVVGMATGFAHRTGRPVAVNLHTAPGLGNAVSALATACLNRAPLVLIVGQQARSHLALGPFLAGELEGLGGRYVKAAHTPVRAGDVPLAVERAAALAVAEPPGPVLVVVPMDDWDCDADPLPDRGPVLIGAELSAAALAAVAAEIDAAVAPALVVGAGVDRAAAWPGAIALAERLGAPVWQEPMGARAGFPQDHPLYAGVLAPSRAAIRDRLAGHDLAIVLGAPVFRYYLPEDGPLLPDGCRVLHLTADPAEAVAAPVGTSVLAALDSTLSRLAEVVRPRPTATRPEPAAADPLPAGAPLTPVTVVRVLRDVVGPGVTVVEECPSVRPVLDAGLPARQPGNWVSAAGGGLGFGLAGAVGLALAEPDRPVLCVVGDGSAAFGLQALWSAVRYRTPVVFCLLVNDAYGVLAGQARQYTGGASIPGLDIGGLDWDGLAAGFGIRTVRVTDATALARTLAEALSEGPERPAGPLLVQCRLAAAD